ncbi:MAG TPA: TolC family protein [Bryobacteraceae bacterium]|nr:TolC family protein [Bryobacteraceae bacterium]
MATASAWPQAGSPRFENSERTGHLIRDGKLALSLQDAIALALENNLDIELQRYTRRLAETDVERAKAGGALRGIPLSIREGPASLGAPVVIGTNLGGGDAPALNRLVGSGAQIDLSLLGSLPLSTGPAVPNLDPTITGSLGWDHQSDPQNNAFLGPLRSLNANTASASVGIEKGLSSGGTLGLSFETLHQSTNSPLLSYSPYSTSSLGLSFRQPLLRGFGPAVTRRYIRIAKNNAHVSDLVFRQQIISTTFAVIGLYWDLVSLSEDVRVRQEAVTSAEQLLADTQESARLGVLASIDVTRARAEVARRQRDLLVAQSLVRQQSEILKDYLTRSNESRLQDVLIEPTEPLGLPDSQSNRPLDALVAEALQARPDLAQARIQLQNSEISLRGSRSALLPALDLVASVRNSGLAGSVNDAALGSFGVTAPAAFLTGGYGDSLSQIFHRNFPDYGVGVQFSIPILNRAAKADVARDQLQVSQQVVRLKQLEKQVRLEIHNAQIALEEARASFESARQERILQEQTLSAEKEKLGAGASTTYLVIQYQRDLTQARSSEATAQGSYWKARAALDRAVGSILSEHGIDVDGAALGGTAKQP